MARYPNAGFRVAVAPESAHDLGHTLVGDTAGHRRHRTRRYRWGWPRHLAAEQTGPREEWFRRLQWAEELRSCANEDRKAVGAAVLESLASSNLATPDDLALVAALDDSPVVDTAISDIPVDRVDEIDFVKDTDPQDQEEEL
ncbi:hypothetical protein D1871_08555 [Nakamurella silvestris]|nr:hypothetical protein D1871_08555 [Nakamurella silvestris]